MVGRYQVRGRGVVVGGGGICKAVLYSYFCISIYFEEVAFWVCTCFVFFVFDS